MVENGEKTLSLDGWITSCRVAQYDLLKYYPVNMLVIVKWWDKEFDSDITWPMRVKSTSEEEIIVQFLDDRSLCNRVSDFRRVCVYDPRLKPDDSVLDYLPQEVRISWDIALEIQRRRKSALPDYDDEEIVDNLKKLAKREKRIWKQLEKQLGKERKLSLPDNQCDVDLSGVIAETTCPNLEDIKINSTTENQHSASSDLSEKQGFPNQPIADDAIHKKLLKTYPLYKQFCIKYFNEPCVDAVRCLKCDARIVGCLKAHAKSKHCNSEEVKRKRVVGAGGLDYDTIAQINQRHCFKRCPICFTAVKQLKQHFKIHGH